ncbi:hypothetical protein OTU49_014764 [Cherax quadricarinatus]|uniref:C2H2-type domain-containing protein n=1 Tax=Cherax quadricarinatus TaxID=27406 RepID=A0AAW0Y4I7_CHEQU|nr:uncharacterized protein LOC128686799 isoform X1 [Cherax quadricarinatus]
MALGKHNKGRLSVADAEDIMEEARSKDFWIVDYAFDNCRTLQAALDVLYNTIPGNKYVVNYQDNQNGTRLSIHCKVCTKDLTSYDPFNTHENGKTHKKCRQQLLTPKDPNLRRQLVRRHLNEPRGIFLEGSLENMIDSTELNVLGVQFVYKEVIHGKNLFTCQLCQRDNDSVKRIRSSEMLSHLTSKEYHGKCMPHNAKYLKVKFGYYKSSVDILEEIVEDIAKYEGKIHANIADFTKQLPPDMTESTSENFIPISGSDRSRCSRSRSCSLASLSPSRSVHSRSKSPRKSESPELVHLPELKKPVKYDVEVEANFDTAKDILKDGLLLKETECREMLQEDADMQGMLIQTLWTLNQKLDKYYSRTGVVFTKKNEETVTLKQCTEKVRKNIEQLHVIHPTSEHQH